jgi:hypothetical protein
MPGWSRGTRVALNGKKIADGKPGTYQRIERRWKKGDVVELNFDMAPRVWVGERECVGKVSLYHGPVLLAYDPRFDTHDLTDVPTLDLSRPPQAQPMPRRGLKPLLLLRFGTSDGGGITLCDYASAGAAGNAYVSWLPAQSVTPRPFSRSNPLRAVAVGNLK